MSDDPIAMYVMGNLNGPAVMSLAHFKQVQRTGPEGAQELLEWTRIERLAYPEDRPEIEARKEAIRKRNVASILAMANSVRKYGPPEGFDQLDGDVTNDDAWQRQAEFEQAAPSVEEIERLIMMGDRASSPTYIHPEQMKALRRFEVGDLAVTDIGGEE